MFDTFRRIIVLVPVVALLLTAAPLAGQARKALTPEDWGKWERLGAPTLSRDGEWLAVGITRVNEENELRVRRVSNPDSVIVVPFGRAPNFSADGRWLAYAIGMSDEDAEAILSTLTALFDANDDGKLQIAEVAAALMAQG